MPKAPAGARVRPRKKPNRRGQIPVTYYSEDVAREICDRIAEGEVWYRICNTGRLPSYSTLHNWVRQYPDFAEALAQAREAAAHKRADQALEVAEATTPQTVSADRLKVSTYQWRAATGAPQVYGKTARGTAVDRGAGPTHVIVEVKRYETVIGPDGKAYVRELPKLEDGAGGGDV